MTSLTITEEEHRERGERLLEGAQNDGYDGVVLFGALNIQYICGMYHLPTERPSVLGITEDRSEVVVPRLEREHAERDEFVIDDVHVYFDYPQGEPMQRVAEMCESLGIADDAIVASAPAALDGLIEARGIGLIRVPCDPAPLRLVVDLGRTEPERLPPIRHTSLMDMPLPLVLGPLTAHLSPAICLLLRGGRIDPESDLSPETR